MTNPEYTQIVGKTVERAIDLDYGGLGLVFTDGTAVEIAPTGYEADGCRLTDCSPLDIFHEQALQENYRRGEREMWLDARERYERGEMKGIELAIYEEVRASARQTVFDLQRQFIGNTFTVPIARDGQHA